MILEIIGNRSEEPGSAFDPQLLPADAQIEQRLLLLPVELSKALAHLSLLGKVGKGRGIVQRLNWQRFAMDVDY